MKNRSEWAPSKALYDPQRRRYRANPAYVRPGSLFAVDQMLSFYEQVITRHARGRLLDCGCGDVPFFDIYGPRTSEVVCVDWEQSAHGGRHVDLQVNLNEPLPFEAGRFDTVLLADVLEHVAEPAALIREIGRVLHPEGKLIAMVPFLYRVHEEPHDYYRYTRFALERLCGSAGLTPLELEAYGGYPDVLADLTNKGLAGVPALCRVFASAADQAARTGPWQRWRRRTRETFPLGYCLVAIKSP